MPLDPKPIQPEPGVKHKKVGVTMSSIKIKTIKVDKPEDQAEPKLRIVDPAQLSGRTGKNPVDRRKNYHSSLAKYLDEYLDNLDHEVETLLKS